MVLDTSALVAIVRAEPERDVLLDKLSDAAVPRITAVNWTETQMVVFGRSGEAGLGLLRSLVATSSLDVVAATSDLADSAFRAFLRYGKGRGGTQFL